MFLTLFLLMQAQLSLVRFSPLSQARQRKQPNTPHIDPDPPHGVVLRDKPRQLKELHKMARSAIEDMPSLVAQGARAN